METINYQKPKSLEGNELLKNANLTTIVGSAIALMLTTTFCYLAGTGGVSSDVFTRVMNPVITAVIVGKMALAVPKNNTTP